MISSNTILLRDPVEEDSDLYFKWINDKKLVEFNSVFKPISKKEHTKWFTKIFTIKDIKIFSIIEKNTNKLIGSCSLRKINKIKECAELQIRLGESAFRNRGYGTEAVRLLVYYGFNKLNLNKIYLHVFENNTRAVKAYEKNNFKKEKLIKKFLLDNDTYKNAYLMINRK